VSRSKSRATVNHHGLRTFAALQHAVLRVYNRLLSSCSSTGGVQAPLRPSGVKTPTLRKSAGIGALHCVASSGWSPQLVFHPPTSLGHFVCYFYGLPAVWPITSYCETQVCAQPDKTICQGQRSGGRITCCRACRRVPPFVTAIRCAGNRCKRDANRR